jgi:hypothetical protein
MDQHAKLKFARYSLLFITLAGSLTVEISAGIAAEPVNTVRDGRVIPGGTYYNTSGGKTTFINSGRGGLWVKRNTSVKGLEVGTNGNLTNHGGTLHFLAPDSVVRIDGKVDVSGVLNGQGTYLGNGGKVFIDSAYLHHSGQIYANGANGGLVQINVGGATIASGSRMEAKGLNGNGGVIAINSDGLVNIGYLALLDTSGNVAGNYDGNVINIEGGAIQAQGVLRADGLLNANGEGSRGGTIRLVATGNTNTSLTETALQNATQIPMGDTDASPTVTLWEAQQWKQNIKNTLAGQDGSITIADFSRFKKGVLLSAAGSRGPIAHNNDYTQDPLFRAGDGGTILLSAMENIYNFGGQVAANGGAGNSGTDPVHGGNGGTIAALANHHIINTQPQVFTPSDSKGVFQANGGSGGSQPPCPLTGNSNLNGAKGGSGGLMAFSYNGELMQDGVFQVNGGQGGKGGGTLNLLSPAGQGSEGGKGGLMVLSGDRNPFGEGILQADGGRGGEGGQSFLSLLTGGSGGTGGQAGVIVSPDPELLTSYVSAFQQDGGMGKTGASILNPNPTSPSPYGTAHAFNERTAENELLTHAENLILLTRNVENGARQASLFNRGENAVVRSVSDPLGTGAAIDEMTGKDLFGSLHPYRNFIVGSSADDLRLHLSREPVFSFPLAEVNLPLLNTLTVINDGYLTNTFFWGAGNNTTMAGGRISLLATGDIENGTGFDTIGRLSGGSINFASKGSINNFDVLLTATLNDGNDIHGGSIMLNAVNDITNFGFRFIGSNGNLIGGIQRYNANNNFTNLGDLAVSTFNSLENNPVSGGCIHIRAGNRFQNGNEFFDPATIVADSTGNNHGYGGFIHVKALQRDNGFGTMQANGSLQNGKIILGE